MYCRYILRQCPATGLEMRDMEIRLRYGNYHMQCCEPKTETRFFRSVLCRFSQPKTDFYLSVIRLGEKTETEKPTRFYRPFFFSCPLPQ